MKKLLVILVISLFAVSAHAEPDATLQYNPHEDSFENVPLDNEIKYNPFNDEFHYTDPDSSLQFNAIEDDWSYGINWGD